VVRTSPGRALHEARTATSRKRKLMQGLVYQFERLSSKLATRSISVGKETQALYGCEYNIGNSVDLSLFAPREKTAFPSLIFVGTWSGRKRGQFVYKAFVEKVLPAYPDAKLYFVADHCDPHPSVVYMSKVSDAELAEAIAKSWVFAYPSAYEGFGIPYIEAMASGTAIVTSPNPGANEVLEDGRYGIISEDADFGDNVLRMIRDDRLRAEFVAAGLDHAQAFGEDQITAQIEAVYEETVRAGK
jgi:glycosyltransferase involved in cell wall biosynthesis